MGEKRQKRAEDEKDRSSVESWADRIYANSCV